MVERKGIFERLGRHFYDRYDTYIRERETKRRVIEHTKRIEKLELEDKSFLELLKWLKSVRDAYIENNTRNESFEEINSFLISIVTNKFMHTANFDIPNHDKALTEALKDKVKTRPLDIIEITNEFLKLRTIRSIWFSSSLTGLVDYRKSWLVGFYIRLCLNHTMQIKEYSKREPEDVLPKRAEMVAARVRRFVDLYTKCMGNINVDKKIAPNKEMLHYVYGRIIDNLDEDFKSTKDRTSGYLKSYLERSLYNDANPGFEIPIK